MERWQYTQVEYNEATLATLKAKIASDQIIFENTAEYITAKTILLLAQNAYNKSLVDVKLDEKVYLELLNIAQDAFNALLATQVKVEYEDSVEICPELGVRALFIKNYHEVDVLEMDVIQLEKPFFVDTGTEFITITEDNFKEFDKAVIVKETTDKYIIAPIEPIEIIKPK